MPLCWEQDPSRVEFIDQGVVHSTEGEAVKLEPYIELGALVRAERLSEGENHVVDSYCLHATFEPLPRLEVY